MSGMSKGKLYSAKETFCPDGVTVVRAGSLIREGHPWLRQFPSLFKEAEPQFDWDVEQATAAPGERRGEKVMS